MNMLNDCADDAQNLLQTFLATWDAARDAWIDEDRDQFEREHVTEIREAMQRYVAGVRQLADRMAAIISQMP
jgi:hypothetical protein